MPNSPPILTWSDAIEHGRQYLRGAADILNEDDLYAATKAALRDLTMSDKWSAYWKPLQINLEATYSTGTIAFDYTGGAHERMVTLTSGTWPTNAIYYQLRIAGVNYKVATRESNTIITLTSDSNPGTDVAASTTYTLFRSAYPLPSDFKKTTTPFHESEWALVYVSPETFYHYERNVSETSGTPRMYTIVGSEDVYGSMQFLVYPPAGTAKTLNAMYHRWPKQLKISGFADADYAGTVTTNGTTTITGTSTTFTAKHVDSVIRFGSDGNNYPTSFDGRFPPEDERVIQSRSGATSIIVDAVVTALTNVKYRISDIVDIDQCMINAYLRGVELQLAKRQRDYTVINQVRNEYHEELLTAMGADHRLLDEALAERGMPLVNTALNAGGLSNYSVATS